MMMLSESRNEDLILSFVKSDKVKAMCGMEEGSGVNPVEIIRDRKNHFLIAQKDEKPVGFICFYPVSDKQFSIHVCLRTIGSTTKKLISMAFQYARYHLDAVSIHAVYSKTARAVDALCNHFGFIPNKSIKVAPELLDKYHFRVLNL